MRDRRDEGVRKPTKDRSEDRTGSGQVIDD